MTEDSLAIIDVVNYMQYHLTNHLGYCEMEVVLIALEQPVQQTSRSLFNRPCNYMNTKDNKSTSDDDELVACSTATLL